MKHAAAAAVALVLAAAPAAAGDTVTPQQVAELIRGSHPPLMLDVRTPGEFERGRVPGAVNVPVSELGQRVAEVPADRPVIVYCETGGRARRAAALIEARGHAAVREMDGSMAAWRKAGLPVEK